MTIKVQVFEDFQVFVQTVGSGQDRLPGDGFFSSVDWYACLAQHGLPATEVPRIYHATAGGASCTLYCKADWAKRKLDSLTSFYSVGFAPVFSRLSDANDALLDAVFRRIAEERPAWRGVSLWHVVGADAGDRLRRSAERAGFRARSTPYNDNWRCDLGADGYAGYIARRPPALRSTLARRRRKAERAGAQFLLHRAPDGGAIEAFLEVYAESWKEPEPYPAFMPALAAAGAAAGALRIGSLWLEGRPVASQFWVVDGTTAVIYKLAHREDAAALSPGTVLTAQMIEAVAFAERLDGISFGYGGDAFKAQWMERRVPVCAVEICPKWSWPAGRMALSDMRRRLNDLRIGARG